MLRACSRLDDWLRVSLLRRPRWLPARRKRRGHTPGPQASIPASPPSGTLWALGSPGAPAPTHPHAPFAAACHAVDSAANTNTGFLSPKVAFPVPAPQSLLSRLCELGRRQGPRLRSSAAMPRPSGLVSRAPLERQVLCPPSHSGEGRAGGPRGHGGAAAEPGPAGGQLGPELMLHTTGVAGGPSSVFHDRRTEKFCVTALGDSLGHRAMSGSHCCLALRPTPRPFLPKGGGSCRARGG